MNGFLLVNKPKGMTSHDVVSKLKRKLNLKKIGHTGTLDPFASGLLIMCVGKATKLASLFANLDKSYEGVIKLGEHFDTYDTTGTVVKKCDLVVKKADMTKAIESLVGPYDQIPPMYSAIKIKGQKLYELARKGIDVERPSRRVNIYKFDIIKLMDDKMFSFFTAVSKGTYIRSLAVDLAAKLNTFAALQELKRLSVGKYNLEQAKSIEDVAEEDVISFEEYFKDYQTVTLSDYLIKLVKNGIYLDERQLITDKPFVVLDKNNQKIAYYEVTNANTYKPVLIF